MATPSRGWRLKRAALVHAPDLVLDEAKGTHVGLLAGVALDSTVAKDATVSKPGTAQTITPPADMALNSTVAKDATVSKPGTAQTITPPADMALNSTVAKEASLPPNFVHLGIADVTGALSVAALGNAPTGATASYTISRTSVGAAPQVDITQYQYAAFGPVEITADTAQTGDSHAFLVYSPAAPGTALWSLTTAGSEISVGGTGNKTLTLTDTDAHTGTAGVFAYVLRNTTDDTVVCEGSLTIEERPNVPVA